MLRRKATARRILSVTLPIGLAAVVVVALSVGPSGIRLREIFSADPAALLVVLRIRMPRIVIAIVAGAALSATGATYQSILRNPLAGPYTLGVSSGAAFGAALGIVMELERVNYRITAIVFALFALGVLVLLTGRRGTTSTYMILLAGILTASTFSAGLAYLQTIARIGQLQEIVFWLMGGLYGSRWPSAVVAIVVCTPLLVALYVLAPAMDAMATGDATASSLGVRPIRWRPVFLITGTVLTATVVSITGIIAWIGVVVPHVARAFVGGSARHVIRISVLIGAVLLLACDTIARTITPGELPISVVTTAVLVPIAFISIRRSVAGRVVS